MIGIHINDETREFSVLPFVGLAGGELRRQRRLDARSARRTHKERMAMIEAGMDPSKLESDRSARQRRRHERMSDRIEVNATDRLDRRRVKADLAKSKSADKVRLGIAQANAAESMNRFNQDSAFRSQKSLQDYKLSDRTDRRKYKLAKRAL